MAGTSASRTAPAAASVAARRSFHVRFETRMCMSNFSSFILAGSLLLGIAQQPVSTVSTGPNFFSLRQDMEIGTESIKEADKILPIVRSLAINSYILGVAAHLTPFSPLKSIQFHFRVVNSKSISTVTYPGGAIYVDSGLL